MSAQCQQALIDSHGAWYSPPQKIKGLALREEASFVLVSH